MPLSRCGRREGEETFGLADIRYNKLLFMIDTCQANTMYTRFYSPNIVATGSSRLGEMSLSHHMDRDLGIAVIDGYTHFVLNYIEELNKTSQVTVQNLVSVA